ncbi:type II toxin-antitoxin system RelE/ParE family toxin [Bradyrhizobium diazoefficiens]|nr:type II toxin-antitoxin system RelE/ParE family toxin [Bradyrhizobium diazoefficiens]QQO20034.1 type II toxin-antitoxin system RelE/ParE family toxin [Bradyrhizobium diazoefficiens]
MILLSPDAVEDVERLRLFLDQHSPDAAQRALASIWRAVERLEEFPNLGMQTEDAELRQIVVRFGASGYIVRYAVLAESQDTLITRIWHGREARRTDE